MEKMSDVLLQFIEPYAGIAGDNDQAYHNLLGFAVAAWNIALLPVGSQEKALREVTATALRSPTPELRAASEGIIRDLIARKKSLFADNQRFIMDFRLTATPTDYRLEVKSTLGPPPGR
jgi:hypothetical protein